MVCHYIFCPLVVSSPYHRTIKILCGIPVDVIHVCPSVHIQFHPASSSGHDALMKTGISLHMHTGHFIMFSVIADIYNKKTKGPALM
jgi:hypothetical protein